MKYMGSKARFAKEILPIILDGRTDELYVEPFCGGCNTLCQVSGNRWGLDNNPYLISMWEAASLGWLPRNDYTEDEYKKIRDNKDQNRVETGYAGFALSYGGKFFGGWCRDSAKKRNYVNEAYRNALKQFPKLLGVRFDCLSYFGLAIPEGSIVYCAPPYKGTTKYSTEFDHDRFWEKVRTDSRKSRIFISEYSAPDDFEILWERKTTSSLTKDTGSKTGVERLFRYKGIR